MDWDPNQIPRAAPCHSRARLVSPSEIGSDKRDSATLGDYTGWLKSNPVCFGRFSVGRRNHVIRVSAFATLLLFATLASLEIGATVAFAWFEDWPPLDWIQESLDDVKPAETTSGEPADRRRGSVLHPYMGYVRNPLHLPRRVEQRLADVSINEFGFLGPSPLAAKHADVARVVVTGGSVAEGLFVYSGEWLAHELEASGAFDGRSVELVSLAIAGFKQPQQLIAVSYLLLLGAEFDAVVNIDGFNEVVLPYTDIIPFNVAASYPFRWNAMAIDSIDAETALAVARIGRAEMELETWRGFFSAFPLRHSAFALASWHVVNTRINGKRIRLEGELREKIVASVDTRPSMRGPPAQFESNDALFENSVEIWRRASMQLWQLCRSQGIAYLHVLQPNQYVTGSKPFTPAERKIAILPSSNPTRLAAEAGYPRMIAAGPDLLEAGLPFVDMTDIFERIEEPIYRDGCCHYHDYGYRLIASRIAVELALASR